MDEPSAYELYRSGQALLEGGDHHAATVPLARARDLEPDSAMVREALGRAFFGARRFDEAATEFSALVDRAPTDHYAQFCLGRSLQLQRRHAEARPPLTMAALLRPDRTDYRVYRDRTVAALEGRGAGEAGILGPGADAGAVPDGSADGEDSSLAGRDDDGRGAPEA